MRGYGPESSNRDLLGPTACNTGFLTRAGSHLGQTGGSEFKFNLVEHWVGNKKWKLSTVPGSIQITSRDSFDTKLSLLCKFPHQPAGSQLCMGRSGGHICFPFCRFRDEPSVWPHPEQPAQGWLTSSPRQPGLTVCCKVLMGFSACFLFFSSFLTAYKPEPSLLSQGTGRRWFVWFAATTSGSSSSSCPLSVTWFLCVVRIDKTGNCSLSWDGLWSSETLPYVKKNI